jgi:peptidoglycan-N-acetylglucosamine deacetylase
VYLVRPSYLIKKLYSPAIWRMEKNQRKIYLTFDDGPIPEITEWVLDLLKEKNILSTFFCVGNNIKKHPELFRRILNENHSVGNHTYYHVNGWKTSNNEYIENVRSCDELFKSFQTDSSKKLFRPPYGKLKQSQILMLRSQYSIIMWDVLSGDYDKKTSPEKCLKNVTEYTRNGSIIVFHDSYKAEKNLKYALPRFIDEAIKKGFEFDVL